MNFKQLRVDFFWSRSCGVTLIVTQLHFTTWQLQSCVVTLIFVRLRVMTYLSRSCNSQLTSHEVSRVCTKLRIVSHELSLISSYFLLLSLFNNDLVSWVDDQVVLLLFFELWFDLSFSLLSDWYGIEGLFPMMVECQMKEILYVIWLI